MPAAVPRRSSTATAIVMPCTVEGPARLRDVARAGAAAEHERARSAEGLSRVQELAHHGELAHLVDRHAHARAVFAARALPPAVHSPFSVICVHYTVSVLCRL